MFESSSSTQVPSWSLLQPLNINKTQGLWKVAKFLIIKQDCQFGLSHHEAFCMKDELVRAMLDLI